MTLILGAGAGSATPSDQTPVVQVELKLSDGQPVSAGSDVVYRIDADSTIDVTVRVFDAQGSSVPVDVADPSALLEIRDASEAHDPVRFSDMKHLATGVYQTSYSFPAGDWSLVMEPDVTDRSTLPSVGVDQVEIRAQPSGPVGPTTTDLTAVLAVISLLVLGIGLSLLTRRWSASDPGRVRRPATPDTWWNGP
jgi:hypothetical protein